MHILVTGPSVFLAGKRRLRIRLMAAGILNMPAGGRSGAKRAGEFC